MIKPKLVPVAVRLEQALLLWQSENPNRPANVTAIAKLAGIPRPTIYDPRFSEFLEKIRSLKLEKKPHQSVPRSQGLSSSARLKEAEFERDVALYFWMEREGAPKRSMGGGKLRPTPSPVILQKVQSASKLETAAGKFFKRAVLSYLGTGSVSLAGFDSLDLEGRALFLQFLELRSRSDCPSMDAYEYLRKKLI